MRILRLAALTYERAVGLWTWRMPIRRVRLGLIGCPVYFYTAKGIETALRRAGFL